MNSIATFPGSVIYECHGKLYQCSYTVEGSEIELGKDHMEVTAEFVALSSEHVEEGREWVARTQKAGEEDLQEHKGTVCDLYEQTPSNHLREARIDRGARVIYNTVLINSTSGNGQKGQRKYTDRALTQIARLAEGLPAYANHVSKEMAFKPRDVRDLIGRHRNVRFDEARHRVLSDLHVVESQADWVFSLAEELGDVVGNSLVSRGAVEYKDGVEFVEEIVAVRSGDLVSDPATTRGLFEHREHWTARQTAGDANAPRQKTEEHRMGKLAEILEAQGSLDEKERTTLIEHIAGQTIRAKDAELTGMQGKVTKLEQENGELKSRIEAQEKELKEAKEKIDGFTAKDAVVEKAKKLNDAIAAHDLGKRFGKVEGAVSDRFKSMLLEAKEDQWSALMDERLGALDAAAKGAGGPSSPKSEGKSDQALSEGKSEIPSGYHARLRSALV